MPPKKNLLRLSQHPALPPALTVSIAPDASSSKALGGTQQQQQQQHREQEQEEEEEEEGDSTADCMAKLKVPTPLLVADNTPTPVRNLLAENPFDEHFRKAAQEAVRDGGAVEKGNSAATEEEETLNTPQIESLLEAEQSSSLPHHHHNFVSSSSSIPATTTSNKPYFRPIAPVVTSPPQIQDNTKPSSSTLLLGAETSSGVVTQRAKLLLQIPNAKTPLHLSDIPVQTRIEPPPPPPQVERNAPMVAPPPRKRRLVVEDKKTELLERNRAAAFRSRQKKKKLAEQADLKIRQLEASNSNLATENSLLRAEVVKLKSLLGEHRECDVTRRLEGEEERIGRETRPKAVAYKSAALQMTQVRVVTVNPQDAAQRAGVAAAAQVELALVEEKEKEAEESVDILSLATQELHRSVSADVATGEKSVAQPDVVDRASCQKDSSLSGSKRKR